MNTLINAGRATQAIVLGVVIVGCATAATITGHLSGADLLTTFGLVGGGAVGVAGAHIGGTVANTAASAAVVSPGAGMQVGGSPATPPAAPAPSNRVGPGQVDTVAPVSQPAPPSPVVAP